VRTLRLKAGLTQAQLAAELGVGRSHITNVENGKDHPSGPLKEALAVFFKVPIDQFFPAAADAIKTEWRPADETERELIRAWRALPEGERQALMTLVRGRIGLASKGTAR